MKLQWRIHEVKGYPWQCTVPKPTLASWDGEGNYI